MDPYPPTTSPSVIRSLDNLVALMHDNGTLRQELLRASSSDEISTILLRFGQQLGGTIAPVDPQLLRDAFRCD
jgi:hypothetical protein